MLYMDCNYDSTQRQPVSKILPIIPTNQRNGELLNICDTIYWGSYDQDKPKTPGISQLPCTGDASNTSTVKGVSEKL